ncbi:MAG TPA: 6-phosphogluconolactonase [Pyrinomonadaceae bacterium]|nr:6-phosphogluconolactonase [Pyrinomonadaceae bacterium]
MQVKPDLDGLSHAAVELLIELSRQAIGVRGSFSMALSGGSTPRYLYSLLASPKYRSTIEWEAVKLFIGDERNVAPDAPESNYRMVKEILTNPLGISSERVTRWNTELDWVEKVASEYEGDLIRRLGEQTRLDVALLGLGTDGHTASLFPRTAALSETERLTVANWVEGLNDYRFTMTLPMINRAANVIFLAAGRDKAKTVANVIDGRFQPDVLPAQGVKPTCGNLYWMLDESAAQCLDRAKHKF